jgi:hypothetical protein
MARKTWSWCVLAAVLVSIFITPANATPADEAAVNQALDRIEAAYARHDISAVREAISEDMIGVYEPLGQAPVALSKSDVCSGLERLFAQGLPTSQRFTQRRAIISADGRVARVDTVAVMEMKPGSTMTNPETRFLALEPGGWKVLIAVPAQFGNREGGTPGEFTAVRALADMLYRGSGFRHNLKAAFACYRSAAEMGDPASMLWCAIMLQHGHGVPQNLKLAEEWARKAAARQYPPAHMLTAVMDAAKDPTGGGKPQEAAIREAARVMATALPAVVRQAQTGDLDAQTALGYAVAMSAVSGIPMETANAEQLLRQAAGKGYAPALAVMGRICEARKDDRTAFAWFLKAAEAGDLEAMISVASKLSRGIGVEKNAGESAGWLRKAADAGAPSAMQALAFACVHGNGVEKNQEEALSWIRKASDLGNSGSMAYLGRLYENGDWGVQKDPREAANLYRKAAEAGNGWAMKNLGWLYQNGLGVEKDGNEAVAWYRKSAQTGESGGYLHLGECYRFGIGVAQNHAEAVRMFQVAADMNNPYGLNSLGEMQEQGLGIAPDRAKAIDLYRRAARLGLAEAKNNLTRLKETW